MADAKIKKIIGNVTKLNFIYTYDYIYDLYIRF